MFPEKHKNKISAILFNEGSDQSPQTGISADNKFATEKYLPTEKTNLNNNT